MIGIRKNINLCEICGEPSGFCICPQCNVCGKKGRKECYGDIIKEEDLHYMINNFTNLHKRLKRAKENLLEAIKKSKSYVVLRDKKIEINHIESWIKCFMRQNHGMVLSGSQINKAMR